MILAADRSFRKNGTAMQRFVDQTEIVNISLFQSFYFEPESLA